LLSRINNAGSNAYRYGPLAEAVDDELVEIVSTNVLGVMLCCREVSVAGVHGASMHCTPVFCIIMNQSAYVWLKEVVLYL
jgi:NAD(P)-dependent dehydrogenase (short-subunit alcohol dehydrogenase family)